MPRETNAYGTIFGGVILSYIDQAGLVQALRCGHHKWVTASIERVDFRSPVHLGDVVTLWTKVVRQGTTSITVNVEVVAERCRIDVEQCEPVTVTNATLTMVAVGKDDRPIPFKTPPTADIRTR